MSKQEPITPKTLSGWCSFRLYGDEPNVLGQPHYCVLDFTYTLLGNGPNWEVKGRYTYSGGARWWDYHYEFLTPSALCRTLPDYFDSIYKAKIIEIKRNIKGSQLELNFNEREKK